MQVVGSDISFSHHIFDKASPKFYTAHFRILFVRIQFSAKNTKNSIQNILGGSHCFMNRR